MRTPAILLALLLAACGGTPPRPAELVALDQLRAQPDADGAARHSPDLVGDSDQLRRKADGKWKSGSVDEARRLALLATVQLKTAIAQFQQERSRKQLADLDKQLNVRGRERARLEKELAQLQEQVALLEELKSTRAKAAADKEALNTKLSREQQKAEVDRRIAAADLAIKNAETVDAARHAADRYKAALETLARARVELDKGDLAAAAGDADKAAQQAQQAFEAARPKYEEAAQSEAAKVRDEALARDAASIAGVTVRLERKGDVTRLRLPLIGLFKGKGTTIRGDKAHVIEAVAKLLAKYPTYPVQITGYTDNKGKRDQLIERSQARAQSVFVTLIQKGLDAKRFVVNGLGPDSPIVDNKSRSGREANNRVEVVLLYH